MPKADKPEKKEKRAKKEKNPLAPKRPLAAYMFFCKETREVVKTETPDLTFGEIGRVLGQKWAAADDKTKKVSFTPRNVFT